MSEPTTRTRSFQRFTTLLQALRDGPLARPALFQRLNDGYPTGDSRRVMVDRDIRQLQTLGIRIEISRTRPPIYTLRGGTPVFSEAQLRTLALIRDTFSERHPHTTHIHDLLKQLTQGLTEEEQAIYQQHQTQQVPLDPAIDYSPFAAMFARLNNAIRRRIVLRFHYQATGRIRPTQHDWVEPYDIEYHDRHFYLVAYSALSRQIHDFRIDRIINDSFFQEQDRLPPGNEHRPKPIIFRYRLAAALARGEISQRFANQRIVERQSNGSVIIEAEGRNAFSIIQTLLRYGDRAELLEPLELRERMIREIQQMAALYGTSGT